MAKTLEYTQLKPGEEGEVSLLVARVFNEFVAPLYTREGIDEFLGNIEPDLIRHRRLSGSHFLVARAEGEMVGMIAVLDNRHISLFFVDGKFQGRGVGRELLRRALDICRAHKKEPFDLTVSSSPNAIAAYESLGFAIAGEEREVKGIRFVPMKMGVGGP